MTALLFLGAPLGGRELEADDVTRRQGHLEHPAGTEPVLYDLLTFRVLDRTLEVVAPSDWTRPEVRARLGVWLLTPLGRELL